MKIVSNFVFVLNNIPYSCIQFLLPRVTSPRPREYFIILKSSTTVGGVTCMPKGCKKKSKNLKRKVLCRAVDDEWGTTNCACCNTTWFRENSQWAKSEPIKYMSNLSYIWLSFSSSIIWSPLTCNILKNVGYAAQHRECTRKFSSPSESPCRWRSICCYLSSHSGRIYPYKFYT